MKKYHMILCSGILAMMIFAGCAPAAKAVQSEGPKQPDAAEAVAIAIPENVNEAGRIPILMYHRITASKSDYDRTPELFEQDLERLYRDGYRPIALTDFVAGRVDVPAGLSPVVITFDDGDKSQYTALENSTVPVDTCAVGIMEAFKAKHPDFNPQATFFVNGGVPFGQKAPLKDKLNYLIAKGYTIGNHTWAHEKLSKQTPGEIQEALGRNAAALEALTGKPVNLLALPYGIRPKESGAMAAVIAGTFEGKGYQNLGICNVGWQPELPAYVEGFDPHAINRIRSGDDQDEAGDWLSRLAQNPENRYISDGDPDTVTVPAAKAALVKKAVLGTMTLRVIK